MTTSREAFKKWYLDRNGLSENLRISENGNYVAAHMQSMWKGFSAGRNAGLDEAAIQCEVIGHAIHGAGREDSEAFDCADAIRALKTEGK